LPCICLINHVCLLLQIPNGLGVMLAVAQVVLYAVYYKSTQQIIEEADQVAMTEVVVDGKPPATATTNGAAATTEHHN
jgi:solute carrier family 50 (sugar transporter)